MNSNRLLEDMRVHYTVEQCKIEYLAFHYKRVYAAPCE